MILVITTTETNRKTGREERIVSHGIDMATDRPVILPCEKPEVIGARYNQSLGEFVLE